MNKTAASLFAIIGIVFLFVPGDAEALQIGTTFAIGNTGPSSGGLTSVDMAYGGGKYAVAYSNLSSQILVSFVNTSGGVTGPYVMNTGVSGIQGKASVAYDTVNQRFGVIWFRETSTCAPGGNCTGEIWFNTITPAGVVGITPVNATAGTSYTQYPDQPDLCWGGTNYAVSFSYWSGSWVGIFAMKISAAGTPMAPPTMIEMMPAPSFPFGLSEPEFGQPDSFGSKIEWNGSGFGVVHGANNYVYYTYLDSNLGVQAGPVSVGTGPWSGGMNIMSDNAGHFGLIWSYKNHPGSPTVAAIYYAKAGSTGLLTGATALATGIDAQAPDIGWDGSRFISAWGIAPQSGVWYQQAATHSVLGVLDSPAVNGPAPGSINTNVGSHTADNYLLVWRYGYDAIQGAFVTNQNSLMLTASPSGGGTATKTPDKPVYELNEQVDIQAYPTAGWIFTGWSGDASGTENPKTITMDKAKSIVANFYNTTWPTLTVAVSPTGAGTATANGQTVLQAEPSPPGPYVSLLATAYTGYMFTSWRDDSGNLIGTTPTSRTNSYPMPGVNTTIHAYFAVAYSVTSAANPTNGGVVNPGGSSLWYVSGTPLQFTATPNAGYTFAGWTVNGANAGSDNPMTLMIDSNKTVYGNFTYGGGGTTYTLTTSASPSGAGSVAPAGTTSYAVNSNVQLTATANSGYVFDHWSGDLSGSTNPTTTNMTSNKSITAVFVEGSSGSAPTVSQLVQTTSIKSNKATFQISYADGNGDLTGGYVNVTYKYKSKGREYQKAIRIPNGVNSITGTTGGIIDFTVKFRAYRNSYKSFPFTAYVSDGTSLNSNAVTINATKTYKRSRSSAEEATEDETPDTDRPGSENFEE